MEKNKGDFVLQSFCLKPNIRFDGQESDETTILVLRAHPITWLPWILNGVFFLVLLLFLNIFFSSYLDYFQKIFVNLFILALIFSYLLFNFFLWFFNVGIVTNKRILDIDFYDLIYKETTIAMLDKIEDITAKVGGFFSSFFDYGSVFVHTAGEEKNIEFINIPRPHEVIKIINKLTRK